MICRIKMTSFLSSPRATYGLQTIARITPGSFNTRKREGFTRITLRRHHHESQIPLRAFKLSPWDQFVLESGQMVTSEVSPHSQTRHPHFHEGGSECGSP